MIPPLLILGLWPIVVFVLFARLKPAQALIWSILGGYLFLPIDRSFALKGFPPIDKDVLPALAALAAAPIAVRAASRVSNPSGQHVLPGWWPRSRLATGLMLTLAIGGVGTIVTNGDPLQYGPRFLVGLPLSILPAYLIALMVPLIPFVLARRFLAHPDAHRALLMALVAGGLAYSLLALYEVRMSPQLNIKIYGYFQHHWNQMVRDGGYRPIVFMQHALWVGIFFSGTILAALVLYRIGGPERPRGFYLAAAGWLGITLVLSKTTGSLGITLLLAPLILFARIRLQLLFAAAIAACVLIYPTLRGSGMFPTNQILAAASSISQNRAYSLGTRLSNEEMLLAKASQRPLFGWSTWAGRNRIYNEDSGRDTSITDGRWIITIGASGWVGYLAEFGLLTGAILMLAFRAKTFEVDPATAGLALMLTGNLIDMIPNGTLTPLTWLMAGALFGRIELGRLSAVAPAEAEPARQGLRYTRFAHRPQPAEAAARRPAGEGPTYARDRALLTRQDKARQR